MAMKQLENNISAFKKHKDLKIFSIVLMISDTATCFCFVSRIFRSVNLDTLLHLKLDIENELPICGVKRYSN